MPASSLMDLSGTSPEKQTAVYTICKSAAGKVFTELNGNQAHIETDCGVTIFIDWSQEAQLYYRRLYITGSVPHIQDPFLSSAS